MKAFWNNQLLASSDKTIVVEGNHYFPPSSLNMEYFKKSPKQTVCHWKGVASYFDIHVGGQTNEGAAWYYPEPKQAASNIAQYIAFWKGVEVSE